MKFESIEDLAKLFDLCAKKGIESMKVSDGSIEFKLKESFAPKKRIRGGKDVEIPENATPEEIALFWSSQPITGE
jgi:hypothetical protein